MSDAPLQFGIEPPAELFELADAVRGIIERMMVIENPGAEVADAGVLLERIEAQLRQVGRKGMQARLHTSIDPGPDDHRPYYAGNARRWHYNPMFPRIDFSPAESVGLRGRVRLGLAYEGPPGYVHGGIIALLFDQILGQSNLEAGIPAMTGNLTVRFRKPTPLFRELEIQADGPEKTDERRCLTRGRLLCDGVVTAEAKGLFVLPAGIEFPSVARAVDR